MSQQQRKIRLGAFISGPGHHVAAWRHPDSQADGRFNFKHLKHQKIATFASAPSAARQPNKRSYAALVSRQTRCRLDA